LVQGDAKSLPFAPSSFDLVFCVNAIHHFDGPQTFIREAGRVLRSGGILAVAGSDPRDRRHRWYLYDYFDGTYETDLDRFPAWDRVQSWMAGAGFAHIESRLVERIPDSKEGRNVLSDPFLKKDAVSQLALLSDEAYARGIGRICAAIDAAERAGESISFKTEILIEMLVGTKRGLGCATDPQVAGRPARGSGTKPRGEGR
jgi:SAM-dependent methyltransferase